MTARESSCPGGPHVRPGPAYKLLHEQPVKFVRGEGVLLFDAEGRD